MVEEDEGVEGVRPGPRGGRGVGLLAEELDDERPPGQGLADDHVEEVGVDLEDDVARLENAAGDQADLAAALLLGRRADDLDGPGDLRAEDRLENDRGVGARGPDDVVAAGVTQSGQGVHLGGEGDPRPAGGARGEGPEGRGHRRIDVRDRKALGFEDRSQEVRCPVLREGQLGIGVDPPAEIEDLRAAVLDSLGDPLPYIHRCPAPMIIQKEK